MKLEKARELKKTLVSTTGAFVFLVILILVNVIASFANIRWDATEDKIYSLSEGTKRTLTDMTEPVAVKFFFSRSTRNLPTDLKLYAKRVREFLAEYEYASGGRVKVEEYDPKVDSDEEEWAQKYGLRALQIPGGDRIYCGLVFLAAEREEKIPLLDASREELLEYDLTRIIHSLQSTHKKVVGVISSLPVFGRPASLDMSARSAEATPWFFIVELKKTYEVREISLSEDRIDPSVDVLFIVHPKDLPPNLQYAVDQYVLSGGNALVFVDPYCVSDMNQDSQRFRRPPASSMEKLFSAWGLSLEPGKTVADLDQSTRVRTQTNAVEDNPIMISARGEAFNRSDVVTSKLENMLFGVAGALKKAETSQYEFEAMVQSGPNAALVDVFKANFGGAAIRRDLVPTGERFSLAVRVRGNFQTAFPAGPPKEDKPDSKPEEDPGEEAAAKNHRQSAKEQSTVIIVADADLLADRFYVQRSSILGFQVSRVFNDNLNFLSNACEILTGSDALIGLRSRGKTERPFTAVLELQRRAQERWLAKEKELVNRVEATNRRLQELQQQKDASQRLLLSPEQEAEIAKFKEEKRKINRELKEVRRNLRADIENLGTKLKIMNLSLMPLFVALAGIGFAVYRQRKMRRK